MGTGRNKGFNGISYILCVFIKCSFVYAGYTDRGLSYYSLFFGVHLKYYIHFKIGYKEYTLLKKTVPANSQHFRKESSV